MRRGKSICLGDGERLTAWNRTICWRRWRRGPLCLCFWCLEVLLLVEGSNSFSQGVELGLFDVGHDKVSGLE